MTVNREQIEKGYTITDRKTHETKKADTREYYTNSISQQNAKIISLSFSKSNLFIKSYVTHLFRIVISLLLEKPIHHFPSILPPFS